MPITGETLDGLSIAARAIGNRKGQKAQVLMHEYDPVLVQAETIAREAKRVEIDRLVKECETSEHVTLRSLADIYRRLNFGLY